MDEGIRVRGLVVSESSLEGEGVVDRGGMGE